MAGTGLPGGSVAGLQGGAEEAKPGEVRTPWGGGGCGCRCGACVRATVCVRRCCRGCGIRALRNKFACVVQAWPAGIFGSTSEGVLEG